MLTFNLKKEWFEKIKSGEKTHEYREYKPYWITRIKNYFKLDIDFEKEMEEGFVSLKIEILKENSFVILKNGYIGEELKAKVKSISLIYGNNTDLKINNFVFDIEFELIRESL